MEKEWESLLVNTEIEEMEKEWESLLVNTEILDGSEKHPATAAGLLLFGKNPNRFLPQAGIDAAAYSGAEKEYATRERQSLRGPMVALRAADGSLTEAGLVEQAVDFVRRNTEVTTHLQEGAARHEQWAYPEEAVREVLVNALVHRDYLLSGTNIELSIYRDRLEVISPGRLPHGITPARMRTGCRSARNELLKDVMRDYGYLEHMGMGVPRKIVRGMRELNGTEPDLIEDEERFIVRLWKEPSPP
jgi:ATP-dependent DNA helicase RecG